MVCCFHQPLSAEQWLFLGEGFQSVTGWLGIKTSYIKDDTISSTGDSLNENSATGRLVQKNSWQGFIYRPWVSTTMINTILQADHNQYDLVDNANQSSLDGLFSTKVTLYPNSELSTDFDFSQRLRKTLSSEEGGDNLLVDTQFSVGSRFQPENETYSANAEYFFNYNDESQDQRSFIQNALDLRYTDELQESNYTFIARLNDEKRTYRALENEHDDLSLQYQHYWAPNISDSIIFSANYTNENDSERDNNITRKSQSKRFQATLTSFVRSSSDDRLTYTVNGFVNQSSRDFNQKNTTYSNANLSAGGFYDYSENIQFSASLDGNFIKQVGNKKKLVTGYASAAYQDEMDISDSLLFSWFLRDAVTAFRGDESEERNLLSFGDGIVKRFYPFGQPLSVSFEQRIDHAVSSDDQDLLQDKWKLTNDLAINWSSSSQNGISTLYMLLTDSRHLTDDKRQFQHVYVSLQRNQSLGANDNWGGDLVYEWDKTVNIFGNEFVTQNAFGTLWYRNYEVWQIPNLRFTSTLDFPLDKLLPDEELREPQPASWQNNIDYRIGFLEFRLHSVNTTESYYVGLEVKRNFDF